MRSVPGRVRLESGAARIVTAVSIGWRPASRFYVIFQVDVSFLHFHQLYFVSSHFGPEFADYFV